MFRRVAQAAGGLAVVVTGAGVYMSTAKPLQATYTTIYTPPTDHVPYAKWDYNWDRCQPESLVRPAKGDEEKPEKPVGKATRYIVLVRHGQYNLKGKADIDQYLTELGVQQSHFTGERLKALNIPFTRVVHSTMTRADQTCQHILEHLDVDRKIVEATDLLREGSPTPPQPAFGHWRPEKSFYTGGSRIEAAFRQYFHRAPASQTEDSHELLVCHANVIRYIVCRALQYPAEGWLRQGLGNGSITLLVVRPDGIVTIRNLGDTGHMPPDAVTFT